MAARKLPASHKYPFDMGHSRQLAALIFALIIPTISAQSLQPVLEVQINAPFVPTPDGVVTAMLKLAGLRGSDTVYDLGCGDGRIVISAAKRYGAHGVGIDVNPERIHEARANAKREGVNDRTKFEVKDVLEANIRDATVVTIYLLPDMNLRLRPKLLRDLRPGTRVVSHAFGIGDWKPEREMMVNGSRIFLWTIPSRVAGP